MGLGFAMQCVKQHAGMLAVGAVGAGLALLLRRGGTQKSSPVAEKTDAAPSVIVHFARHGLVHNPQRVFYGRLPGFRLAAAGEEQAVLLGKYLSSAEASNLHTVSPTKIISSPLQRAMETASVVSRTLTDTLSRVPDSGPIGSVGPIEQEPGVLEVHCPFDGQSLEFMQSIGWDIYDPAAVKSVGAEPHESFGQLAARAVEAVQRQAKQAIADGHRAIVITSHGDVCCAIRLWAAGRELNASTRGENYAKAPISYCGVVSMEISDRGDCINSSVKDWDNLGTGGKKV